MDERVFRPKCGQPIPAWDLRHRLPLEGGVSPECKDTATIFRINSTFMDVSDQPHMSRQWLAGGTIVAGVAALVSGFMGIFVLFSIKEENWSFGWTFNTILMSSVGIAFAQFCIKYGRDEFFSLTAKTVRFNRREKCIYAVRRRKFGARAAGGDFVLELPWNENSIFCIHRGTSENAESYHIRCYQVDENANVVSAIAIGRTWDGYGSMEDLLAQWNYWCTYMNVGPAELPKPLLFLSEDETIHESFLYCLYELGFGMSANIRMMFMPFVLLLTSHRIMSLITCRKPIWPEAILQLCRVNNDDEYDQPRDDTPVGWGATALAHLSGAYPQHPMTTVKGWTGEADIVKNAARWLGDEPQLYNFDSRRRTP